MGRVSGVDLAKLADLGRRVLSALPRFRYGKCRNLRNFNQNLPQLKN
jgi:hypothetical protein